jgi:hypothetical protein
MRSTIRILAVPAAASLAILAACSDTGTSPNPGDGASLSFVVGDGSGISALRSPSFSSEPGTAHTLVLQHVEVVLARVRLRQKGVSNDSIRVCDQHPDACPEFRAGPVLLDLPLAGGVVTPFATPIPAGSYDRLLFNIFPPKGDDTTAVKFRGEHNWPASGSIRVRGTYDGAPFDIFLNTVAEMRVLLDPPFTVAGTGATSALNVTVAVDANKWFRTETGQVIDPRALTADHNLLETVERNIRASIRAFNDNGRKGRDEHHQ